MRGALARPDCYVRDLGGTMPGATVSVGAIAWAAATALLALWIPLGALALPSAATATAAADAVTPSDADADAEPGWRVAEVVSLDDGLTWVRMLGWSARGDALAWRGGKAGSSNQPGAPLEIVELGPAGGIRQRQPVKSDTDAVRRRRAIHDRGTAPTEAHTGTDVLMAGPRGTVLALVTRIRPRALALMRRDEEGKYRVVFFAALPLEGPSTSLEVRAYGAPGARRLAVMALVGYGPTRRAGLWVVSAPAASSRPPR